MSKKPMTFLPSHYTGRPEVIIERQNNFRNQTRTIFAFAESTFGFAELEERTYLLHSLSIK